MTEIKTGHFSSSQTSFISRSYSIGGRNNWLKVSFLCRRGEHQKWIGMPLTLCVLVLCVVMVPCNSSPVFAP